MHTSQRAYKLVPPHIHCTNAFERAIQNFKNHPEEELASLHLNFSLSNWERLLEQAELISIFLRSAQLNPKLPLFAFFFGQFDYNKTPISP